MRLADLGRLTFALSVGFFGAQYLVYGHFANGLPPGQEWSPPVPPLAYALGAVLFVSGLAMLHPRWAQPAALAVGVVFLVGVVLINGTHVPAVVVRMVPRTNAFQPLAFGAAALVLAAGLDGAARKGALARAGRSLFGFSLFVFGLQHFMYTAFIASLIPPWVPAHAALVYVSGLAFMAAGVGIALNVKPKLAGVLLGVMMILFVVLIQVPPLVPDPSNGDLWSSVFEPLALCGGGLIIAAASTADVTETSTRRG